MAQLSYLQEQGLLKAGVVADSSIKKVDTKAAEGDLSFGRAVVWGATANQAKLAVASAVPMGVVLRGDSYPTDRTEDILSGETIAVLTRGVVMMEVADTVTAGAPAYAVVAVGANQGKAAAASAGGNLLIGKFLQAGTAGNFVKVEVQL